MLRTRTTVLLSRMRVGEPLEHRRRVLLEVLVRHRSPLEPRAHHRERQVLVEAAFADIPDASTIVGAAKITGRTAKIEQFIAIMVELGLVEVSRTGIAAIGRGAKAM